MIVGTFLSRFTEDSSEAPILLGNRFSSFELRMEIETSAVFWLKVRNAFERLAALILFAGGDKGLMWVLERTVFEGMEKPLHQLVSSGGHVAFGAIYVYLLWDMLAVFFPFLKRKAPKHIPAKI